MGAVLLRTKTAGEATMQGVATDDCWARGELYTTDRGIGSCSQRRRWSRCDIAGGKEEVAYGEGREEQAKRGRGRLAAVGVKD